MISLTNILQNSLNETLTFTQLLKYSDKKRKNRSRNMRVRSMPVTSEKTGDAWNFTYKSAPDNNTTGKSWKGRISFLQENKQISAEKQPVIVDCSCPDYRYKWAYANKDKEAGVVGVDSLSKCNGAYPTATNPHVTPGLCKHLISLKDYLKTKLEESKNPSLSEGLDYVTAKYPTFAINVEE